MLIIITPVIILQLLTTIIFYKNHWASVSRNLVSSLSGEVSLIINGISSVKNEERKYILQTAKQYMSINAKIAEDSEIDLNDNLNEDFNNLIQAINRQVSTKVYLFREDEDNLRLEVPLSGDVLNIIFSEKRVANPSTYIFVIWVLGSAFLLLIVSVIFMRNQVKSITSLSKAAERFGKGLEITRFKPVGAKEIRQAGIAFIEMKERIKRLIETRTQMLAGVSHDLRTPLTRMKLIVSMLENQEQKASLEQEVDEMQKMIEEYLNFTQLEVTQSFSEPVSNITLRQFIEHIGDKYRNFSGVKLNINIQPDIEIKVRPEYFARAIQNLLDNNTRFAKYILIRAQREEDKFTHIFIDDDGPGIPDDKLEEVFTPFYRIDESRNSETGGVGLGMTIARDIIHKSGGEIKLSRSHLGGLRITITIPF